MIGHMNPPFDYSDIPAVEDFGLANPAYNTVMSFDDLANTLESVYGKGNKDLMHKYKKLFIDGEKIVDYMVNSNGENWMLLSNYARIFKGGGGFQGPEIKEFNYWVLPEYVKVARQKSQTLNTKSYDSSAIAQDIYDLWGRVWKDESMQAAKWKLKVEKKKKKLEEKKIKKADKIEEKNKNTECEFELIVENIHLNAEIEKLTAENEKLKADNTKLKKQMTQLQKGGILYKVPK